jgi:hypothetical protein
MINFELSKFASFGVIDGTPTHPTDNEIHIFTQFFISTDKTPAPTPTPANRFKNIIASVANDGDASHQASEGVQRNAEIKQCLYRNYMNPHITKIHLLNERIYTDAELCDRRVDGQSGGSKIVQTSIGKRLTFKDVFKYIRENHIAGYCVLTNADIFFDNSLRKILYSSISTTPQMFALLRYEYRGETDLLQCPIFGPRFDSQDTWIIHYSKNTEGEGGVGKGVTSRIKEIHEKAFDFEFGRPGCDNKFAYLANVLGYEVINDPRFIRTYHYHTNQSRNYTRNDVIGQPYTLISPAGFNPYTISPSLGVDIKTVIGSTDGFQKIRFNDNDFLYNYISGKLEKGEKFIIPRISGHENNFAFFGKVIQHNALNKVDPVIPPDIHNYFQNTVSILKQNAGIRLTSIDSIVKYSNGYLRAFENCDIYGGWEAWGHYMPHIFNSHNFITTSFPTKRIFWVFAMDIYHYIYSRPFTTAMRGRRILIVSPFEKSIRSKLENRSKLYDGVDLFPDCSFVFISPPITNGDNPSDEFDVELMRFFVCLDKLKGKYDIALLSCGGYANPIANYIYENHGASAIYIGGVLQMYFGIYGGRWLKERAEILKLFMNGNWSRPEQSEKPANFSSIEGGCYW